MSPTILGLCAWGQGFDKVSQDRVIELKKVNVEDKAVSVIRYLYCCPVVADGHRWACIWLSQTTGMDTMQGWPLSLSLSVALINVLMEAVRRLHGLTANDVGLLAMSLTKYYTRMILVSYCRTPGQCVTW